MQNQPQSQTSQRPIPEQIRETTDGVLLIFNQPGLKRGKILAFDESPMAKERWLNGFDVEPKDQNVH